MTSATAASRLPVLVVDDDSALIRTLADILRFHGYDPSVAGTGEEGLALAASKVPALAVIDLRLPDMDGVELVSRLHALSELTEVVVLTGNASVESAVAAMQQHSVDYLLKPVNVEHLLHVASVATERWQRRHAEERLRRSDERFRKVVESDMLGITFWNAAGIYDANDAFLRIVGYDRIDLATGHITPRRLTPPEYAQVDARADAELRARGTITPYEKEYVTKNGKRVPVLVGASILQGPEYGAVAFVLDVTSRKQAEVALRMRARQQAAVADFGRRALVAESLNLVLTEAVTLIALTLDLPFSSVLERRTDGRNLVYRASTGWPGIRIGQTEVPITSDTQAGHTLLCNESVTVPDLAADSRFAGSAVLPREHGIGSGITTIIPGAVHPYGVLEAHDRKARDFTEDDVHFLESIAHVIGTVVERTRTEAAFRQAQRLEAVGRLASGVSHDFNNMLTAITGYAEIIKGGLGAGSELHPDVEEILQAAGRATALTRQLLAFSRQQVLEPRVLMLNDVVSGIENMLRRLMDGEGNAVELVTSLDPELGLIKADPGQLEQVIMNLVVNARDALPNGGRVTVETQNVELDPGQTMEIPIDMAGDYVMLAVTDNGIGMDPETRARIFEPFFTTKAEGKGTGLGLATVYGIVKQSDGEVYVYSEQGRGTTFKVFLPRIDERAGSEAQPPARAAVAGGTETILLAEDEDVIRRLAVRILERAGYRVLVASNGEEALQVAQQYNHPISMLITDMVMPKLDGRQLIERLRAKRPQIRVILLSGYTDMTVAGTGEPLPETHFLQKPFTADALARRVREVLDLRPRVR
jgi:PAS domain S-box-containing protein